MPASGPTEESLSALTAAQESRDGPSGRRATQNHVVQFYESDEFLCETVARYLGTGLIAGETAIAIATDVHGAGLCDRLSANGLDVPRLVDAGRLILLDAQATLGQLMRGEEPSTESFDEVIGGLIRELQRTHPGTRIRAFGEVVDLLWRDGNKKAAVRFEELWGDLTRTQPCSLLCAYVLDEHCGASEVALLEDVCRRHTHVFSQGDPPSPDGRNRRLRELGVLHDRRLQSEERFRLLVESVKDYAIFMLDPDGRVASWNIGAQRIKGYEGREIIGKHFSTFYPREDVEAGKCEYELEVAEREGRFEDEGWRVRKDTSTFWASVVITAVRNDEGRLIGFAKVTRDLTVRREAEEERLRRARAEEGERRAKDFLAVLGHELRNPLAPVATAVQLIKLRRGLKCDKEIAVLERQVAHMLSLVEDLLDVSRALRDKVELSIRAVEVSEVLANALDIASPLIQQKHHTLVLDAPEAPLFVEIDAARTVQVFSNLLNNAAKYTDPGGDIRVRITGDATDVHIAIEDTGIGIAPEFLDHVFELFAQGDGSVGQHSGGLGIGLAVAKRLVTQQGGAITVASDGLGRGSRFIVRLPRSAATSSTTTERPPAVSTRSLSRRRVLVVDDNADAAETMRLVLEHLGHEVVVALDGPRGLALAGEFKPDAVFLDIGLPTMSGLEVVRRMRQMPVTASIPIIAVSGYARDADRARSLAAGFSRHIAKPFEVWQLAEILGAEEP